MRMQWQWTPDSQWMQLTPAGQWAVAAALIAVVAVAAVFAWNARIRRRRVDARIAQLTAALALLTDTVEAGFQDVLRQTAREPLEASPAPRIRANTQRRVKTAARRGRAIDEIAATERLSEGEVRLMLQMSGTQPAATHHAEMR